MGNKRPFAITIICILGFLDVIASVPIIFFGDTKNRIGPWFPAVLAAFSTAELIALLGAWKMKKWSVFLWAVVFAAFQGTMLLSGNWSITSLVSFASVFLILLVIQCPKMN